MLFLPCTFSPIIMQSYVVGQFVEAFTWENRKGLMMPRVKNLHCDENYLMRMITPPTLAASSLTISNVPPCDVESNWSQFITNWMTIFRHLTNRFQFYVSTGRDTTLKQLSVVRLLIIQKEPCGQK